MAFIPMNQNLRSVADDASWILSGDKLEKLFTMTNFDRDESVMKFARQLRGMVLMKPFERVEQAMGISSVLANLNLSLWISEKVQWIFSAGRLEIRKATMSGGQF